MEILIISVTAFIASGLTLFSGFGLGTILLPAFGIFFPLPIAVAMTAVVHFSNNILKLAIFAKNADFKLSLKFGGLAILFSWIGAQTLLWVSVTEPLGSYVLGDQFFYLRIEKILLAAVMIFFALFEIIPFFKNYTFDQKWMFFGGALSGFFGGLSGHQGALRSAFLIRSGLDKSSFIATGVLIACAIDITRISAYSHYFRLETIGAEWKLISIAILSAFAGVGIGNHFAKKITIQKIQMLVAIMLVVFGIGIGLGMIGA